jgi:hypothetical protein
VLSYENLYDAPVAKLKTAVDEWTTLIGKLEPLGEELAGTVARPLRSSGWTGDDAVAAMSFIAETGKEFTDAVKEATGVRDILQEAHDQFVKYRDELHRIAGQDAPAAGFQVTPVGKVVFGRPPPSPLDSSSWRGKGSFAEAAEDLRSAFKDVQKRIERARAAATEADETAARALNVNLAGEKHNFNPPTHTTLAGAWQAGSEANFRSARSEMFDEMKRNIASDVVKEIKKNADGNLLYQANALRLWNNQVAPGHVWDHKPALRKRFGLETLNEFYFKDPTPGKNRAVSYDIWSNLHYGYVGSAAGLSRWTLETGAQVPGFAGRTDEGDKITVRAGVDLYEKYGPNLTREQFEQEVGKVVDELETAKADQVRPWIK